MERLCWIRSDARRATRLRSYDFRSMSAPAQTSDPSLLAVICAPGMRALRQQWKPFVFIQLVALALVLGFYFVPGVAGACEFVARVKEAGGGYAAAVASAVAGAILPEIAKVATAGKAGDRRTGKEKLGDFAFNVVFFGVSGWIVYEFYVLQAYLFGNDPTPATIAKKVALDMLGFSTFWSVPFGLICFTLKRHHFRFAEARPHITPGKLLARAPAMLIPMWAFWLPMVLMIYSLPAGLQFGLFTLALAAWSLLLVFVTGGDETPEGAVV